MTPDAALVSVLAALEAAGVPYMIVGSLASNFHGVPRSTRDADIVVQLSAGSLERLRGDASRFLVLEADQYLVVAVSGAGYAGELCAYRLP